MNEKKPLIAMQACDVAKSWIRKMDAAERYGFLLCTCNKELTYPSARVDYFSNKLKATLYVRGCQESRKTQGARNSLM